MSKAITVRQAADRFLIDQQLRGNTDKTIEGYKGFLRRFLAYLTVNGVMKLQEMTIDHIYGYQLYINSKANDRGRGDKLTKRSVQTYIRHIKVFAGYCYEQGLIPADMRHKIRIPKAERPITQILTDGEIDGILSCFGRTEQGLRDTAIVYLMLDCGLRLGEVPKIKKDDINFEKGYVCVTGKGRRGRIVPLGKTMRQALTDYLRARSSAAVPDEDAFMFLTKQRAPVKGSTLGQLMKRLKKRTGIKRLRAHLFRHTFATNYLLYGLGDVYELSRLLGHSDIKVTEWYLQLASYYAIMERRERSTYLDRVRGREEEAATGGLVKS